MNNLPQRNRLQRIHKNRLSSLIEPLQDLHIFKFWHQPRDVLIKRELPTQIISCVRNGDRSQENDLKSINVLLDREPMRQSREEAARTVPRRRISV